MTDWSKCIVGEPARTQVMRLDEDGRELRWCDVIDRLAASAAFRAFVREVLATAPWEAFYWETPPVTLGTLDRPFELALVDAPPLSRIRPDREAFAEHFARSDEDVLVFANLGGDATLIVPAPRAPDEAYAHLARFLREAPGSQVDALLREIGRSVATHVGDDPLWVSTAGLGVSWLHVRLDARPKYYRHAPYKRAR